MDRREFLAVAAAGTVAAASPAEDTPAMLPVIDTHHHIWLRKDIPWLADPPVPRMYGDYFGLRRDNPVEEWIHDVTPEGVTKSVHVTAMWGTERALDETRWLQETADRHGFPHGIVFQADMTDPDLDARHVRFKSLWIECVDWGIQDSSRSKRRGGG